MKSVILKKKEDGNLKVLTIGFEIEEARPNLNIIESRFQKNELCHLKLDDDLVEVLTSDGPFSFVIINLENQFFSAQNYYESITDLIGKRPFIFVGNKNSIKSQLTAEIINDHSSHHMLETPMTLENFKVAINQCLNWVKEEEFEQSIVSLDQKELRAIRLRNFYLFDQIPYDGFIEIIPGQYAKIISKNKFYPHSLISNYSKKNIKFIYLQKDEHIKFLDNSIKSLITVYKTKAYEKVGIVKVHAKTCFFIREYIRTVSVSEEIIELVKLFTESIYQTVKNNQTLNLLLEFDYKTEMNFAEESLISAYISEGVMIKLGWYGDMTKGKLALASLLQDIHLSNDEFIKVRHSSDPNFKLFSEEDKQTYLEHPIKGAEIARLFNGFSDVDFIILEHHEHPTGEGFPRGINVNSITQISSIFILTTHFTSRLAKSQDGILAKKEILAGMKKIFKSGNFKEPMQALIESLS